MVEFNPIPIREILEHKINIPS